MSTQDPRLDMIQNLNALLEREYNSVVQYLLDCDPWVPEAKRGDVRNVLGELAAQDRSHAERLVRMIVALEGTPVLGHYTREVVNLSYLSIVYALEKAVAWKKELVGQYNRVIDESTTDNDVARVLVRLREEESGHAARLSELLSAVRPPEPVPEPAKPDAPGAASSSEPKPEPKSGES